MSRAKTVHELRLSVSARDKAFCATKPLPEAVKYIHEHYETDADSAAHFVRFIRGLPQDVESPTLVAPGAKPAKSNSIETWHLRFDDAKGEWIKVDDREQAG
jgi:hypothetical protein